MMRATGAGGLRAFRAASARLPSRGFTGRVAPPGRVNEDFRDLLAALLGVEARFLVVGAHALAVHGVPRATGALDVWIAADPANAERVWYCTHALRAPVATLGVSRDDLTQPDRVVQIGLPRDASTSSPRSAGSHSTRRGRSE